MARTKEGFKMKIEYKTSVSTPAGWRSVYMIAEVEKISDKRVKIMAISSIDGENVSQNMSRTGSKRQNFYGDYFAKKELDKIKNLSQVFKIIED